MIVVKGTGINVYNMVRTQINSSFTLDRGPPSPFVYSWDTLCFGGQYVSALPCGNGLLTLHSKQLPAEIGRAIGGIAAVDVMAIVLTVLYY